MPPMKHGNFYRVGCLESGGTHGGLEAEGNILIGVSWVLERRMEATEIELKVDPMGEHVKRTDS